MKYLIREANKNDYIQLCGLYAEVDQYHHQAG